MNGGQNGSGFVPSPDRLFIFLPNFRNTSWNCGGFCASATSKMSSKMSSQHTNLDFSCHLVEPPEVQQWLAVPFPTMLPTKIKNTIN